MNFRRSRRDDVTPDVGRKDEDFKELEANLKEVLGELDEVTGQLIAALRGRIKNELPES